MTTAQAEVQKLNDKLNRYIEQGDYTFNLVARQERLQPTSKEEGKKVVETRKKQKAQQKKAGLNFEEFDGTVHLYPLKDTDGNLQSTYNYNCIEGKPKKLVAGENEQIFVLDFLNDSEEAIATWQCTFDIKVKLEQQDIVNAKLISRDGDRYTLGSVIANSRIPVGKTLTNRIFFRSKLVDGKIPIAFSFELRSGDLKKVDAKTQSKPADIPKSKGKFDYAKALGLTLDGVTWQTQGKKPAWNKNPHRGDCFLDDGAAVGKNFAGGLGDAGDAIRPIYAASINACQYAMPGVFYQAAYKAIGQWEMLKNVVKHYNDDVVNRHEMKDGKTVRFWHWISSNKVDHQMGQAYEKQGAEYKKRGLQRECFAIDHNERGTEPCTASAASLAMGAKMLEKEDPELAKKYIQHAKALFAFGDEKHVKYVHRYVYESMSTAYDEICLAAISIFMATNDKNYLNKAEHYYKTNIKYPG